MCMYLFNIWYGRVSFVCSLCLQRFFPRPPASSHSPNTWMSGSFPLSPYDTWNSPPPNFLFFCDNSLTGEAFRDSDRLIFPDACSVVHILLSMFSWSCVCVVVKLCAFGFVGVRVRVCARMQSLCLCICSLYDLLVCMCELMHVCKFIGCVLHYNVFVYWYYCAHTVVSEMCASDKWVHADECVYFCQCAWV